MPDHLTAISIHVTREGDDRRFVGSTPTAPTISIHVTREGDDATTDTFASLIPISIHVTREGDDWLLMYLPLSQDISIHVTREGDDRRPSAGCPPAP